MLQPVGDVFGFDVLLVDYSLLYVEIPLLNLNIADDLKTKFDYAQSK